MFIAVKRQRLAVALEIMARGFAVGKETLTLDEPQFEQLPAGIVNEDQQGAF